MTSSKPAEEIKRKKEEEGFCTVKKYVKLTNKSMPSYMYTDQKQNRKHSSACVLCWQEAIPSWDASKLT